MRLTVGLLACLSMVALSQAMAADPTSPSAAASAKALPATAVSSSEAPAAGMPAAPSSATSTPSGSPTGTPAAPPAATAGGSPDKSSPSMADVDKKLRAQGYKVETHGSQKVYCRIEPLVGSRFDRKICATPEEIAAMQQDAADSTSKMQKGMNTLKGG